MKLRFFSTLRFRLVLLVLFAVVPAMAVISYMAREQRRANAIDAQQHALQVARLIAANQHDLIEAARQLLIALAQVPLIKEYRSSSCSEFMKNLLKEYSVYTNFGVVDRSGDVSCSALPVKSRVNAADRSWF